MAISIAEIFQQVKTKDIPTLLVVFVLLVLGSLLWELLNQAMNFFFHRKRRHLLYMFRALCSELALLGIVSFLLLMIGTFLSEHTHEVVEAAHLTVFMVAVSYVSVILFVASTITFSQRRMRIWERDGLASLQTRCRDLSAALETASLLSRPLLIYRLNQLLRGLQFFEFREVFLQEYQLPPTFPFHKYLRRSMQKIYGDIASVHWTILLTTGLLVFMLFTAVVPWIPEVPYSGITIGYLLYCCVLLSIPFVYRIQLDKALEFSRSRLSHPRISQPQLLSNAQDDTIRSASSVASSNSPWDYVSFHDMDSDDDAPAYEVLSDQHRSSKTEAMARKKSFEHAEIKSLIGFFGSLRYCTFSQWVRGCCSRKRAPAPDSMLTLFPMRSNRFLLWIIELIIFACAIMFLVLFGIFSQLFPGYIWSTPVGIVVFLLQVGFFVPDLLYSYTVVANISDLAEIKTIKRIMHEMNRSPESEHFNPDLPSTMQPHVPEYPSKPSRPSTIAIDLNHDSLSE